LKISFGTGWRRQTVLFSCFSALAVRRFSYDWINRFFGQLGGGFNCLDIGMPSRFAAEQNFDHSPLQIKAGTGSFSFMANK